MRFRVDVAPLRGSRRRADIVFTRVRLAVYVDGCFWHSCAEHGTIPKNNRAWWIDKLDGNVRRDRDTDQALAKQGWAVLRVWEHEPADRAADRIVAAYSARANRPHATI
jgi:DNA mismatch endonuclease, patch repair protein